MKVTFHWLGRLALTLSLTIGAAASLAQTQISIGISVPGVSIGINTPAYPQFVLVPNYPVYYAPEAQNNYFFYDGLYWVYQQDNWYSSSWYDGPWYAVAPRYVPLYVLRVPVRYYRHPPSYFRAWQEDAPPRWGEHWGNDWSRQRGGWDRWDRRAAPAPAPLPIYQRQYSGERYPRVEQQPVLQSQNYRYQPRDPVVRQHYQQQIAPAQRRPQEGADTNPTRQGRPDGRDQRQQPQQPPQQRREPQQQRESQQQPREPQQQWREPQTSQRETRQQGQPQQQAHAQPQVQQPTADRREPRPQGANEQAAPAGRVKPPEQGQGRDKAAEQGKRRGNGNGKPKDAEPEPEPGGHR